MLPDPIAAAINSPNPAMNFTLVKSDGYGSERRVVGGTHGLIINHTTSKSGDRHYLKMVQTVDAVSPYSGLTSPQSASVSLSIARPAYGFDDAAIEALYKELLFVIGATGVGIANILAFQS